MNSFEGNFCIFWNGGIQTAWLMYLRPDIVHNQTSLYSSISKSTKKSFKPGHLYAKIILILNTQNWYSTTEVMLVSGMLTFSPIKYFLSFQIGTPPLSWLRTIPFFSKRRFLKHTLCIVRTFSFLEYPRKLRKLCCCMF